MCQRGDLPGAKSGGLHSADAIALTVVNRTAVDDPADGWFPESVAVDYDVEGGANAAEGGGNSGSGAG